MKKIILIAIVIAFVFTACNSENTSESNTVQTPGSQSSSQASAAQMFACTEHPDFIGLKGEKCSKCGMELSEPVSVTASAIKPKTDSTSNTTHTEKSDETSSKSSFSINEIISNYLTLKNALTKDESQAAANAGNAMVATLRKMDTKMLSATQLKSYNEIVDVAKENAEHIGANAGKLDHQREHFALLSVDMSDLIKIFGTTQKLYQDYCPMYDDKKGAIWISETKEIKNPYYGSEMLSCGSMKKEL